MPLRSEPQALKAEWRVNAFLEQVGNRASRSFALNAIFWLSIAELAVLAEYRVRLIALIPPTPH